MRLTQKGQVTIPHRLRKRYGLTHNTEVVFEETDAGVLLRPASNLRVERLAQAIDSVRGRADNTLSTDEVMAMTRG